MTTSPRPRGEDGPGSDSPGAASKKNAGDCEIGHRPRSAWGGNDVARAHAHPGRMTMIDMLAFAVVALALAAPGLINLVWGKVDIERLG